MPRYWVIAPYRSDLPEVWERVWRYDLEHGIISVGFHELADPSGLSLEELRELVGRAYPERAPNIRSLFANMLWAFYNEIQSGDLIIARRGRKRIAGVGTVAGAAYYDENKTNAATEPEPYQANHLPVRWHDTPRDKDFDRVAFGMMTLYEIDAELFSSLVGPTDAHQLPAVPADVEDHAEFVLERYLEEFIVTNFPAIFGRQLAIYRDPEENVLGQQYATEVGPIDILAVEPSTDAFVVIELKKGRGSDAVVGQTLRYMGWVSENLASAGQQVRGLIICREADPKLSYALKSTPNIAVKYYAIDFRLREDPG